MSNELYSPKSINPYIKDIDEFKKLYNESIENPKEFYEVLAKENISWLKDFEEVHNNGFSSTRWFSGGQTNVSFNCIDRHLNDNADKVALIWEGDDGSESKKLTYQELHDEVCKFANVLKNLGVEKGS